MLEFIAVMNREEKGGGGIFSGYKDRGRAKTKGSRTFL